jgi:hypothetical protein
MTHLYLIPHWFFLLSIIFEIIFAIITISIAYYSFKVYKLSKQKDLKWFGIGFLLIALSYIIWFLINIFLLENFNESTKILNIKQFLFIGNYIVYFYIFLFITGLSTIVSSYFKNHKINNFILIETLVLISIFLSPDKGKMFYITSSIFLAYLSFNCLSQYLEKGNKKALLSFIAFLLIFIGQAHFILATKNYIYYVIGHFVSLAGYFLMMLQLRLIIKHE